MSSMDIVSSTNEPKLGWHLHQERQEEVSSHLDLVLKIVALASAYLISVLLTIDLIILSCLFVRFLRVKLGKRTKPDHKKAILITGATSGIGLVIAKYFFEIGFTVIGGYFNDQEPGYAELLELSIRSSCSSLLTSEENSPMTIELNPGKRENKHLDDKTNGAQMFLVKMDVRSRDSIEKSSQEIDSILDHRRMDLYALINNAGVANDAIFLWSSRESISDSIDTNLKGAMMVSRQFLYRIIKSGGRVINVASGLCMFPTKGISVYGSTKSALAFFSESLDAELRQYGASCRCVIPGNFSSRSNILFPKLRSFQDCISKLSQEERDLYKESMESYRKMMDRLVRKRFSLDHDLDPVQVSSVYGISLPDDVGSATNRSTFKGAPTKARRSLMNGPTNWLFQRLGGGAKAESLEDSGLIEGYDCAVRVENCPRRIYSGNRFYSHFSGPVLDFMPRVVLDLMAKLVMMSIVGR